MSSLEILIRLAVMVPLVAFLFWKRRQRELRRLAEYEASVKKFAAAASPIQLATLAPRVRQVREDYFSALHVPVGEEQRRTARVAAAREAVSRKDYFQHGDALEDQHLAAHGHTS